MPLFGNAQSPDVQPVRLAGAGGVVAQIAPQLGLDPGHQFQRVERLGDVVVRAEGEAGYFVHILHPCGEHDDGKKVLLADPAAERKAVHVRQHYVQNGQVRLVRFKAGQRFGGSAADEHPAALVLEIHRHQVGNFLFVVHHQDGLVHSALSSPSGFAIYSTSS